MLNWSVEITHCSTFFSFITRIRDTTEYYFLSRLFEYVHTLHKVKNVIVFMLIVFTVQQII